MKHYQMKGVGQRQVVGTWKKWAALVVCFVLAGWFVIAWLSNPGHPSDTFFLVSAGEGANQIADNLKQDGFIRSKFLFVSDLRASGLAEKLKPGKYNLSGVSSYREISERLVAGGISAEELVLKVIEGWDLNDIKAESAKIGLKDWESLFLITGMPEYGYTPYSHIWPDFRKDYSFLESWPQGLSLEGYLFPDTYRIFKDASIEDVVRKLLDNFESKIQDQDLLANIASSDHSLHEVVTMASLLEKEVRGEADRKMIADIFWRRLGVGMALQADSTINYVTGKNEASASAKDLDHESLYNTYQYPGLPPGPICNPGMVAIRAAVSPQANDYWYFLTDEDGNVHYAVGFDEHKLNKARYLR